MNDHQHVDSDIVRAIAMPEGSEDVPPNPPIQDSPIALAYSDQETAAAASAPTHPAHADIPAAQDPTRTSQPDRPAAQDPTYTSQPDRPAAQDPTHTSQPGQPAALDPTRTSHPNHPAAQNPTRASQPDRPAVQGPTGTDQPGTAAVATSPTTPPQPSVPQLRNPARYHILGEHGRGGLGKVSRAHDLELGRDVAIKELLSRSAMHEVRFMREALITARLEHPGIVPVHEAGRWPDGTPFYAMKLVAGRPLRDLLAERKTIDERIALLHHVIAVADAMAYAHGRNIIHRDLKPSNVIVGDFGETVVIDWGLAKDLSGSEESTGGGSSCVSRGDDLTSAGAVLGTPAYMAPEQRRGEPVDQRVDVYAIGVMLWELCSLEKLPPGDSRLRRGMLRTSGIDPDLFTIIEKALDSDPDHRYEDAGALAADLKAFKAGARIAARRYSLWALLAHWIRRHRTSAIVAAALLVVGAAGVVLYVRDISNERDRADLARERADAALVNVELSRNELTLQHAELLLQSNPTAAAAALASYHGPDTSQKVRLLAEAVGRGIAKMTLKPHTDSIHFIATEKDGTIISLAADRYLRRTTAHHTTTLASDAAPEVYPTYAPVTQKLAYWKTPSGIVVFDLSTGDRSVITTRKPSTLAFDPTGTHLAALDEHNTLTIWTLIPRPEISYQRTIADAIRLTSYTDKYIVIMGKDMLSAVSTIRPDDIRSIRHDDLSAIDAKADVVIGGDKRGVLSLELPMHGSPNKLQICNKAVTGLSLLTQDSLIAFVCKEGTAGFVRFGIIPGTMTLIESFSLEHVFQVFSDFAGRYAVFAGQSSTFHVYDRATSLLTRYEGSPGALTFVALPTADRDQILTGDNNGNIFTWNTPTHSSRLISHLPTSLYTFARFDDRVFAAAGRDGKIYRLDTEANTSTAMSGHTRMVILLLRAPDGSSVMSFGDDNMVRLWQRDQTYSLRTFTEHTAPINDAAYLDNGRRVASAGDDGNLFIWSVSGHDYTLVFKHTLPLVALESLSTRNAVVIEDSLGSIWSVNISTHAARQIILGKGTELLLRASLDGRMIAVGESNGLVTVYDTSTWTPILTRSVSGEISQIRFDPDNRNFLVLTKAAKAHLISLVGDTLAWRDIPAVSRNAIYSPSGDSVAILCRDGTEWFYSFGTNTWKYTRSHDAEVMSGDYSSDERHFTSVDTNGVVITHEL